VIRRVFRGRSPYGLIRYLYSEGRRNEHTEPHLIASWDDDPAGLEPAFVAALDHPDVAPLVRTLARPVCGCDLAPQHWVYHLVLRNGAVDRRLSDDEWAQVCREAMERTGIAPAGDPAGCRWVAVRHAEEHVHLVATLAREDGRRSGAMIDGHGPTRRERRPEAPGDGSHSFTASEPDLARADPLPSSGTSVTGPAVAIRCTRPRTAIIGTNPRGKLDATHRSSRAAHATRDRQCDHRRSLT